MKHTFIERRRRFLKVAVAGGAVLGFALTAVAGGQQLGSTPVASSTLKMEDVASVFISYRTSLTEDDQSMELPLDIWSAPITAHGASYRIKVVPRTGTPEKYGPIFTLVVADASGRQVSMNLGDRATGTFPDYGLQFMLKAQTRPALTGI
jgi:hypothetical protein